MFHLPRVVGTFTILAAACAGLPRADAGAAVERPALVLLDSFADPAASAALWAPLVAGTGAVKFEANRMTLDMPPATVPAPSKVNLAQVFSKTPLPLVKAGDQVRIAWDMQLLEDRFNAYGFGMCLGDPAGQHIVIAQTGNKSDTGVPHDFYVINQPRDQIDHGTGILHYDVTVTLDDPATGKVHFDVLVYTRNAQFDAAPELYPTKGKQIAKLASTGEVPRGADVKLYFCVERDDAAGDPYVYQQRAKISVSNVYISAPAAKALQPELES